MTKATINHDYLYGSYKENKNHGFPLQRCAVCIGYMDNERTTNRSHIAF